MTTFDKRLCNALQIGLPVKKRPYAEVAGALASDEDAVLKHTRTLVENGIIRRIAAVVNWRALGRAGTLVTACVPQDKLQEVAAAVGEVEGVSHNYLREHRFNLWFTLRCSSEKRIETILTGLSKRFGIEFHSLPVVRTLKLDVRFDAESDGQKLLESAVVTTKPRRATLDKLDERILAQLAAGLEVAAQPYDFLCRDGLTVDEVLARIERMLGKGLISRLGAVVDHCKLGFVANAMFVCKTHGKTAPETARALAALPNVSHCYERRPFEHWPYNLFAMMHGPNMERINSVIGEFVNSRGLEYWDVLPTLLRLPIPRSS